MTPCHVNGIRIGGGAPVRLMGVLNLSPESFYSHSYVPPERAREEAFRMLDAGADIVDIGGRATGPTSVPIDTASEKERVCRALRELEGSGITISLDTCNPEVLEAALRFEVHAVNDISGLSKERMGAIVRDTGIPMILMASNRVPGDAVGIGETLAAMERVVGRCARWGLKEFVLDPGIGLWIPARSPEHDWELCQHFFEFTRFGRPLLAAVSRKTFIGRLLHREADDRLAGSLAVAFHLMEEGASIVRAHDVRETKDVITVFERLREGME